MNKVITVFAVLILCAFSTNTFSQRGEMGRQNNKNSVGYKIGDKATDFSLRNVDGEFYSLADIEGAKGYIVIFTGNICPFAVGYQDRIINLHRKMVTLGYHVVAINSNDPSLEEGDSFENMQVRAKEKGFPFLYLKDDKQEVYPVYGATKTPHVFLLDKGLTVQYIGAIDDNSKSAEDVEVRYVEDAIMALENGQSPDPNFTKAIGCPIKSKNNADRGGRRKRGGRKGPPSPEKTMEMMDKDEDGKISKEEAMGPMKNDFSQLDENGDGFITVDELGKMKRRK